MTVKWKIYYHNLNCITVTSVLSPPLPSMQGITAFYTEMREINESDMSHLWKPAASKHDSALPQPETHSWE